MQHATHKKRKEFAGPYEPHVRIYVHHLRVEEAVVYTSDAYEVPQADLTGSITSLASSLASILKRFTSGGLFV